MRNAMLSIVTAVVLTSVPAWAQFAPVPADQLTDVCPGDLNGDMVVNSTDMASILGRFGFCRSCDEDLDHDGSVDEADVRLLALQWGSCASDEDVITRSSHLVADVSDDPEIYEGDVATHDDVFSDARHATCEGDLDRNGHVESTDLAMLLGKYGRCKGCEEDLNDDGVVDDEDLDILFDIWGACPRQGSKHVSRSLAAIDGNEIEEDLPPQNEPEEEEPQCPGDLDGNGTIDNVDLAMLLARYGRCYDCEADLTGDGYVDRDDIDEIMALWGDCAAGVFGDASSNVKIRPESLIQG